MKERCRPGPRVLGGYRAGGRSLNTKSLITRRYGQSARRDLRKEPRAGLLSYLMGEETISFDRRHRRKPMRSPVVCYSIEI
jgi:hypothetical protein